MSALDAVFEIENSSRSIFVAPAKEEFSKLTDLTNSSVTSTPAVPRICHFSSSAVENARGLRMTKLQTRIWKRRLKI